MNANNDNILWTPGEEQLRHSNMARFIEYVNQQHDADIDGFTALHTWSVDNREQFWASVWDFHGIVASRRWDKVLQDGDRMPGAAWFGGAELNFAENLLKHCNDNVALVFHGENGERRQVTYNELHTQVSRLAQALKAQGVVSGDRVAGFMPNIPETIVAMLATASIGAVWSSCSPDFGVNGVLDRFGQIEPKILFTADGYHYNGKAIDSLERVADMLTQLPDIERVVVIPMLESQPDTQQIGNAVLLSDFVEDFPAGEIAFEQLPFDHPLYIMYSSGTTGIPKCIVHGAGGTLMKHLTEITLHSDVSAGDTLFFFTTCGWMMWNWLASGLATGATLVLYDGSPFHPGPQRLFDIAQSEGINYFGASAKYYSSLENAGVRPAQTHDLSALRAVMSTGSPLAPESFDYVYEHIKPAARLSSISGGTDLMGCFATGSPMVPVRRGEIQCLGLGMKVEVFDDEGQPLTGEKGELVCTAAFPSMPIGFWDDADNSKYHSAYFDSWPGIWAHGDYAELTENGGMVIYGRSDAVLNASGVRIGTAEIYRQVEKLPEVVEGIAVGQQWDNDTRIVLFVKLESGITLDDNLMTKIKTAIRTNTTPRHVPAKIIQVADIPRTISGKIVELAVQKVIHNEAVKNTDALANPEALELFRDLPELQS